MFFIETNVIINDVEYTVNSILPYAFENSNIKLPMASMTKVMSLILFFEAIEEKRLKLTQELSCSEYASSMGGSQIFLSVGERMSVDDLLKSVCIASANDATVMLAEAISGSEVGFVTLMNNKAKEMGLYVAVLDFNPNAVGIPFADEYFNASTMDENAVLEVAKEFKDLYPDKDVRPGYDGLYNEMKLIPDSKLSVLNEYEFNDIVTLDNVITCLQRAEMVMKISEEVNRAIYELGADGFLVKMQLEELRIKNF